MDPSQIAHLFANPWTAAVAVLAVVVELIPREVVAVPVAVRRWIGWLAVLACAPVALAVGANIAGAMMAGAVGLGGSWLLLEAVEAGRRKMGTNAVLPPPPPPPDPKGDAGSTLALLLAIGITLPSVACVTPHSRPLASYAVPAATGQDDASETRAECRRLRDRSMLSGAGSATAGALASGLAAMAGPVERERWERGLNVAAAVTAALGAGLAILSTSYGGVHDAHCTPWPTRADE